LVTPPPPPLLLLVWLNKWDGGRLIEGELPCCCCCGVNGACCCCELEGVLLLLFKSPADAAGTAATELVAGVTVKSEPVTVVDELDKGVNVADDVDDDGVIWFIFKLGALGVTKTGSVAVVAALAFSAFNEWTGVVVVVTSVKWLDTGVRLFIIWMFLLSWIGVADENVVPEVAAWITLLAPPPDWPATADVDIPISELLLLLLPDTPVVFDIEFGLFIAVVVS
jgi:hypothetical protein